MPDRIIRESICTSETIDKLGWFEEVLWHRLTVNCDDYGRFDGRPAILKGRLFPLKDGLLTATLQNALQNLENAGLIQLYTHDGRPYIHLVTWEKYQRVRANKSKYPAPPPNTGNGEQATTDAAENRERKRESKTKARADADESDFFEEMWRLYPRQEGKAQVTQAQRTKLWQQIGREHMQRCVQRYADEKRNTAYQFIQKGSTFFNGGYEDYLDENYGRASPTSTQWKEL